MTETTRNDPGGLLAELTGEVGRWEASPYYIPGEELFDIERFLDERGATALRAELERRFGAPLNHRFWSAMLPYEKLRRARREIADDDLRHEGKRRRYLDALEEERRTLAEWAREAARPPLRIISGGKSRKAPAEEKP